MSLPDPASESGRLDWNAFLRKVLPVTDFFAPSLEELSFMMNGGSRADAAASEAGGPVELGRMVLSMGAGAVMIKLGIRSVSSDGRRRDGGHQGWGNRELYRGAFVTRRVAGTTGAGDAAVAGALAAVSKGCGPEKTLAAAAAAGACCVEEPDASSGIGPWDLLERRLSEGWRIGEEAPPAREFRRGDDGTWRGPADQGY